MKTSATLLIASLVVTMLLFTGCREPQQTVSVEKAVFPQIAITADCVAHYYKTNAADYITSQQHGFNPAKGFFRASSTEPTGAVECSLLRGEYQSSSPKHASLSDLPGSFWSRNLAIGVFYSFCAGGGLLETDSMVSMEPIKIEGQWYTPIKPQWPGDLDVTLLQSIDTEQIAWVQLEDAKDGTVWLIRNYNLLYSKELGSRLPRTIDVFDIRNGVAAKDLMVRFDYKNIQK